MKLTNRKITIAGSIIKINLYKDKALSYGATVFAHGKAIRKSVCDDEGNRIRKLESKKRSLRRTRVTLINLINANAWQWKDQSGTSYVPIFVTFTFKDDIKDIQEANAKFSHFIRRLNYVISGGCKKSILKYVSVIEFQDLKRKGVIHFHTVFFNLPNNSTYLLSHLWEHGTIDQKAIKEIENVGLYISKTMSAGNAKDTRLDGKKRYIASKGLLKPIEIRDQDNAKIIQSLIPKKYMPNIESVDGFQGRVERRHYMLDRGETLSDVIPELNEYIG